MKGSSLCVHKKGQFLVETLIAMAAAILIISGLVVAVSMAVKNAQFSKNQALATKYATEEMEKVRQQRDTIDWNTFWTDNNGKIYGPTAISGTAFSKTITYEDKTPLPPEPANTRMGVTVRITWTDASGTHESNLVTYFTRW